MAKIYITSKELIKLLKISSQKLLQTEQFFDAIPDDDWELVKDRDYRVVHSNGLREYTESGAYTIARYLEVNKKKTLWDILDEWFLHTKEKIRQGFVRQKILANSSSLMKRNNRFWVSKKDAIAIFGTKSDYLSKMAEHAKQKEYALIKGEDFEDFLDEGGLYYSSEGMGKLSIAFAECLTKKNRQAECRDVGKVIQPQVDDIVRLIEKREKSIINAKNNAKKRDDQMCQVTKKKGDSIEPLKLAAHHLYSQNEYPLLADSLDNLITISCDVHDQFHLHYMGGYQKVCTIDHFIDFVHQYYPDNMTIINWLQQQKLKLGQHQPVGKKNPSHVLYVPYSRVS